MLVLHHLYSVALDFFYNFFTVLGCPVRQRKDHGLGPGGGRGQSKRRLPQGWYDNFPFVLRGIREELLNTVWIFMIGMQNAECSTMWCVASFYPHR